MLKYMIALHITSVEDFRKFISQFGIIGPLVLTIFQAFQVVVPVLPGYLGCAAGAMVFGSTVGFICNYVGICTGSIASYFIARKLGMDVVLAMFSEKQYNKWSERICKKKSYDNFLFVATLLPLFPDDFLCYFSGLIKMNSRRFIKIILLGKPWCILAYSLVFGSIK
ncbi:MAG: TVP38/TMEM64 family protein [Lachnospiraceae bacterium]|nr:TVP38/TMEM64 family protein [Lachnospiraceae bacterium]